MIPVERHQQILTLVEQRGVVSIAELTERLGVSHMTIRRDLQKLEENGAVLLVSGGVRSTERLASEPSHFDKTSLFSEEKRAIGAMAARHIPRNSCIYLDAGTTTLALARELEPRDDLLIVTNDFVIANFIIDNSQCRMIHTGGTLYRENRSCAGDAAAQTLRGLSVDIAFISASCWSQRGIFTPDEEKIAVKRAACEVSGKRVLLADSSKYNKIASFLALPVTSFDCIITDPQLPGPARQELAQRDLDVILAV
ncbi:DeoR family transcriptional regulator [Erwinia sp. E602]|uniref:DNA-binding transcriptional repressor YgbI n=1 Tax=unclassified Erwinia TaxID=2622719 RepID=UPI000701EC39|nr:MULTISPECIES: DNA-binding transcriptional repressor YgbI [unclassified Erwinia]KQN54303.1 DeoR family transcriptional regulator [Erwinia sp. Leaf53]PLV54460.1 DeoR family transcriptional regulator [Erwinia sp. B116]QUG76717.1 DeoR family transcriptional regulator [Erwinia sp. E602]